MEACTQQKEQHVRKVDWNSEKLLENLYSSCRNS